MGELRVRDGSIQAKGVFHFHSDISSESKASGIDGQDSEVL
jgi:hypothetical protein